MSKVFVANYAGHDYTEAKKYGELVFITKGYVSFASLDRVLYVVTEALLESKPDDWLLLSGSGTICVFAALGWLHLHGRVNLLIFDQRSKKEVTPYRESIITKESLDELLGSFDIGDVFKHG